MTPRSRMHLLVDPLFKESLGKSRFSTKATHTCVSGATSSQLIFTKSMPALTIAAIQGKSKSNI